MYQGEKCPRDSKYNHCILGDKCSRNSKHHLNSVRDRIYFKEIVSNTNLDLFQIFHTAFITSELFNCSYLFLNVYTITNVNNLCIIPHNSKITNS
jgi:hypothetical protein